MSLYSSKSSRKNLMSRSTAKLKVVKEQELPDIQFAECRTIAHAWRPYTVQDFKKQHEYLVTLQCPRCDTRKSFIMTYSGVITHRYGYSYPANYLSTNGRLSDRAKNEMNLAALETMRDEIQQVCHISTS